MKSRDCCTQMDLPFYCGFGGKGYIRRHRQLLLGIIVLLIICWAISSVWLISLRRSERSREDIGEQQATVALLLPAEMLTNR